MNPLPQQILECFACNGTIVDVAVFLGETYDGVEKEWPFHETCADGPWPLYETRRVDVHPVDRDSRMMNAHR
jgi:hypothetical protein